MQRAVGIAERLKHGDKVGMIAQNSSVYNFSLQGRGGGGGGGGGGFKVTFEGFFAWTHKPTNQPTMTS